MCLGVPGEVVDVNGDSALVDIKGIEKEIRVDLIQDLKEGDWILNHAGFAIKKISEEEARKTLDTFDEFLGEEA